VRDGETAEIALQAEINGPYFNASRVVDDTRHDASEHAVTAAELGDPFVRVDAPQPGRHRPISVTCGSPVCSSCRVEKLVMTHDQRTFGPRRAGG